jgi:hypothetical protein
MIYLLINGKFMKSFLKDKYSLYGSCHFQTGLMHENGVLNTYQIYQLSVLFLFTLH